MRDKIYCIGDSHVSFFSGQNKIQSLWPKKSDDKINIFETKRLGAVLAHGITHYGSSFKGKELLSVLLDRGIPENEKEIPKNSKVLFCFGEIDCRAHLLRQAEIQKKNITPTTHELVNSYFDVIMHYSKLGFEIIVWGVIPSTAYNLDNNKSFPTHGTAKERNKVSQIFNEHLEQLCSNNNIKFISIFSELTDSEGNTNMSYYMDKIHLSQNAMPIALKKITKIYPNLKVKLKNRPISQRLKSRLKKMLQKK